jgi:hypothetical protein
MPGQSVCLSRRAKPCIRQVNEDAVEPHFFALPREKMALPRVHRAPRGITLLERRSRVSCGLRVGGRDRQLQVLTLCGCRHEKTWYSMLKGS